MHIRRCLAVILLFTILLPNVIYADAIPAKDGYVQDLAGMIPKESISAVEQAAQGELYQFYLLTINSLDGEDPADYATSVYQAWGLTADDILLLISNEEHRVEMNFNNSALQAKIDALSEDYNDDGSNQSKLSEFVDKHFIPQARDGDFAGASITLMNATNSLTAPASSVSPTPAPDTSEQPSKPSAPIAGSPSNSSVTSSTSSMDIPWLLIAVLVIVVIAGLALGYMLLGNIRNKKLQKQIPEIMAHLNRSSERIQSYTVLYQGETQKTANAIDQQLTQLLLQLKTELEQLTQLSFISCIYRHTHTKLKEARNTITQKEQAAEELLQRIIDIEDTEKQVSSGLIKEQSSLGQVQDALSHEIQTRQWALAQLTVRAKQLEQEFQRIDEMDAFDPLQANTLFLEAQNQLDKLEQDVAAVAQYAQAYRDFSNEAATHRDRFESIIKEHQLKLVHIDPYGRIEQAHAANEQLFVQLQDGAIPECDKLAEQIRQLLTDSVQMVQRLADLKVKNAADIEIAAKKLAAYPAEDRQLHELTERIRPLYRTKHWQAPWQQYLDILHVLPQAEQQLRQVRTWCEIDVQEYVQAREALDLIFKNLQERDQRAQQYTELIRGLDQTLADCKRQYAAGEKALLSGNQVIARNQLIHKWNQLEQELKQLQQSIHHMLADAPYDMELLKELCVRFLHQAEDYLQDVERTAALKRNAEARIAEMERNFMSVTGRTRGKINVSRFNGQYAEIQSRTRQLMSQGRYEDAVYQVGLMAGIIASMNSAYESVLAEERRQEAARRASQHNNHHSSGGSNWGGGGSHSSGGSSWSSNKNNNSSGGSNW